MHHSFLKSLLSKHPGIALGEGHTDRASYAFLIDHMDALKETGVKSIALEGFHQDTAPLFEEYFRTGALSPSLETHLTYHELYKALGDLPGHTPEEYYRYAFGENHPKHHQRFLKGETPSDDIVRQMDALLEHTKRQDYTVLSLMRSAREAGIEIVPVDQSIPEKLSPEYIKTGRLTSFNENAGEIARNKLAAKGKYVLVAGARHVATADGVAGLSERLGIPSVVIEGMRDAPATGNRPLSIMKMGNTAGEKTHYATANVNVDYVIHYPKKSVGVPERILPPPCESWFRKPSGKIGIGAVTLAAVAGIGYYIYRKMRPSETDTPHTQLAGNSERMLERARPTAISANTGVGY